MVFIRSGPANPLHPPLEGRAIARGRSAHLSPLGGERSTRHKRVYARLRRAMARRVRGCTRDSERKKSWKKPLTPTLSPQAGRAAVLDVKRFAMRLLSRTMALRIVSNLRATAMRATGLGLPAATRRSKKAFSTGLKRAATKAPMNSAVRTVVRPPPMKLLPRHWPDWRVKGARPARARYLPAVDSAELGQLRNQGARDGGADAGHAGQQVLLLSPTGEPRTKSSISRSSSVSSFSKVLSSRAMSPSDAVASSASRVAARPRSSPRSVVSGRPDRPASVSPRPAAAEPPVSSPRRSGRSPPRRSGRSWHVAPRPWRRLGPGPG